MGSEQCSRAAKASQPVLETSIARKVLIGAPPRHELLPSLNRNSFFIQAARLAWGMIFQSLVPRSHSNGKELFDPIFTKYGKVALSRDEIAQRTSYPVDFWGLAQSFRSNLLLKVLKKSWTGGSNFYCRLILLRLYSRTEGVNRDESKEVRPSEHLENHLLLLHTRRPFSCHSL